jgi:hypothetical protein
VPLHGCRSDTATRNGALLHPVPHIGVWLCSVRAARLGSSWSAAGSARRVSDMALGLGSSPVGKVRGARALPGQTQRGQLRALVALKSRHLVSSSDIRYRWLLVSRTVVGGS